MISIHTNHPTTNDAIKIWGTDGQLAILCEECAEVITAVSRYNRGRYGPEKIAEEIADVIVCLMSVLPAFNIEHIVIEKMIFKLNRLNDVINTRKLEGVD